MKVRLMRLLPLLMALVAPGVLALESPGVALRADVAQVLAVLRDQRLDTETRTSRLNVILEARFDLEQTPSQV